MELLVVITIIGILIALLLPAVQAACDPKIHDYLGNRKDGHPIDGKRL